MDEIEFINILKGYSDKIAKRLIKSPAFLFCAAIWWQLAHSRHGPNYICKEKHK